ncbi:FMN-binding negative transcriptional regulator [Calidifontibacillus erzurumensis]|uniref:FMN-binding negative transcriptional regulator n=1 Tax=Calidifontibacillus erzurumensis TaxID=2741433 RepID=UPI0022A83E7F|nr:FMN-binding negative transcriptional regulator [Calidifontibacillus erzurumensis]
MEFMKENSFGTIVTVQGNKPNVTDVPLKVHKQEDDFYITNHMEINNSQWKTFEDHNVLVIYQGSDRDISSSWYEHENVPTWNYQALHVYGKDGILNDQELEEDLKLLLKRLC